MSSHPDVLVTLSTFAEGSRAPLDRLEQSGLTFRVNDLGRRLRPEEVVAQGRYARGIVAGVEPYDSGTLEQLERLRCISRCGAGTDAIDHEAARRRGIAILNTPDEPTIAVAEMTLALILSMLREIPVLDASVKELRWQRTTGRLLHGKVVGLVGVGRIGARVAELLLPFGVRLLASDPVADAEQQRQRGIELVELDDLLRRADIVSLHAAASTQHSLFLGREELMKMKPGAWLVNVARGPMVDDEALADLLSTGRLTGAALDVFPEEPYRGPLRGSDRVILTPHQATLTLETRAAMELKAVENMLAFLNGSGKERT